VALQVGQLYAVLGLQDAQFKAGMAAAKVSMMQLGSTCTMVGTAMTAAITLPLIGLGYAAIQAAGSLEQTRIALKTMLGSAERAEKFIQDMRKFAAETPFEFSQLIQASKQLLAFGYSAESIIPMMTNLGNAVSSVGGDSDTINRIIMQLGQMKTVGRASMMDLRPIAQAGIRVFDYLAESLGKSTSEVMKMMEAGKLSAEVAVDAIMKGMGKDPKIAGMMKAQMASFLGMWSNVKDQLFAIMADLGTPLLKIAKSLLKALDPVLEFIKKVIAAFAKMPTGIQAAIVAFLALVAAAGPFLAAAGGILTMVGSIAANWAAIAGIGAAIGAIAGPIGWVVLAIVAIGAALAAAWKYCRPFREMMLSTFAGIKKAVGGLWDAIKGLWRALAPVGEFLKTAGGAGLKGLAIVLGGAFRALAFILEIIIILLTHLIESIEKMVDVIMKLPDILANIFLSLFSGLKKVGKAVWDWFQSTFKLSRAWMQDLTGGNILYAQLPWLPKFKIAGDQDLGKLNLALNIALLHTKRLINEQKIANEERKRAAIQASMEEADAILKVIEERRKAVEELKKQRAEAVGFTDALGIGKALAIAAFKSVHQVKSQKTEEITLSNLPQAAELKKIQEEIKETNRKVEQLNKTVRERLAYA